MHKIGFEIKKKRMDVGIGAREMAKYLKISKTQLEKLEASQWIPDEKIIKKLCLGLGLNFDEVCCQMGIIPSDIQKILLDNSHVFKIIRDMLKQQFEEIYDGK
jgi:transcriptional regulator with XRE-family HTH domain